jgi:carboxypeptidase C (cathepsin A)
MHTTLILVSCFWILNAQFVNPPTDLVEIKGAAEISIRYKQVPSEICALDSNVASYSGYADVAPDQHIFWWFFEAKENPEEKPLTLWLNGGPGYVMSHHSFNSY